MTPRPAPGRTAAPARRGPSTGTSGPSAAGCSATPSARCPRAAPGSGTYRPARRAGTARAAPPRPRRPDPREELRRVEPVFQAVEPVVRAEVELLAAVLAVEPGVELGRD